MRKFKRAEEWLKTLLLTLPAILFFSYQPIIPLGSTESMNLELSLPLIWILVISLFGLFRLPKLLKAVPKPILVALAIIPCYTTFSIVWSNNPLRTVLTVGILWCILLTILTFIEQLRGLKKPERKIFFAKMRDIFLQTAVLVAIFAWVQCILDVCGVAREYTLLCEGCTYAYFGFPHPNAFAIEPQFFGNLLLAPALLTYYSLLENKIEKSQVKIYKGIAVFLTTTLFFSFSRGAIYAFLIGVAGLVIYKVYKKGFRYLKLVGLCVATFILALFAQGMFSQVSPTTDTFLSGVTKAVHHLSLGVVDLREKGEPVISAETETTEITEVVAPEEPVFDGYVAESTEVRLNLNSVALDVWNDRPKTLLFGTGLGGAGVEAYAKYPELGTEKQIIQNEYLSLLLELGLIGVALILGVLIYLVKTLRPWRFPYLVVLVVMYGVSLLFFSGLPNALHIYLLPLCFFLAKDNAFIENKV